MTTRSIWIAALLCIGGVSLVLGLVVLPLAAYMNKGHIEERRLANDLNSELNNFLESRKNTFGWVQSYWDVGDNLAIFEVYGAGDERPQTAVLNWLATVRVERHLRIDMEARFFENPPGERGPDKLVRTVRLPTAKAE
jgi:hypothetical protein